MNLLQFSGLRMRWLRKVRPPLVVGALAAIALWLLNSAPAAGQAPGQAGATKQPMAEQAFKNVTVLKGIPVDEFMDTMGFISAATNYNCTDCHVEPKVETGQGAGDGTRGPGYDCPLAAE